MTQRAGITVARRGSVLVLLGLLLSAVSAVASGIFAEAEADDLVPVQPAPAAAPAQTPAASPAHRSSGLDLLRELQASYRAVAASVMPVVVQINTTRTVSRRQFSFSPNQTQPRPFEQPGGTGSGIIVSTEGGRYFVLTNNHVIENRDHILVTLDNGEEYEAELVGTDPRQDIAVVSFDGPRGLPTARLGDSSRLVVGDLVLAVGSPFGLQSTVTSGIISALGRETSGTAGINIAEYIQTDAAINPGNSGGALVNLDGEVIGVNTWIASRSGGNVGVGFALPINAAKRAIRDFLESGQVRYGYLGVFVSSASSETRASLGVDDIDGALAWSIILDSPAALGDLRPGDWITHVSGRPVGDSGELVRAVGALEPGQESTFDLVRAGVPMQVTVVVALRDDAEAWAVRDWPGIFPVPLTDRVRARFEIADNQRGMLIASVNESSATSAAGLRVGDIITHVNGAAVRDAADFYRTVGAGESGEYRFRIVRDGVRSTIDVNL
ncbi:MAG: trypsin-like peptidase domain-containing protein [Spirochaetaceae bacterium]|nr:trypsin-like peptidase domain-containing protein [Spirochaetaceae bacterium]